MIARLDQETVNRLAQSFPNDGWTKLHTIVFGGSHGNRCDWNYTKDLEGIGGVYAILLPTKWFHPSRTLPLHAPHRHKGEKIQFEFVLQDFAGDGYGVAYVGKTINLRQRWRGHLMPGERKDGGQVKFGLLDCGVHSTKEEALRDLRINARIVYTKLSGPDQCANRDLLEMALCARLAPPFNIKSER